MMFRFHAWMTRVHKSLIFNRLRREYVMFLFT